MNWFEVLDVNLFYFFNQTLSNALMDELAPALTNVHKIRIVKWVFIPGLLLFWFYRERKKAGVVFLAMIITAGVADLFSYRVIKSLTYRDRPNNNPEVASVLRVPYGPKSSSFPSNHATNTFAAATTLAMFHPATAPIVYTFAAFIAYTRVYVGVHFVSDVIAGTLLGIGIALMFRKFLFRKLKFFSRYLS